MQAAITIREIEKQILFLRLVWMEKNYLKISEAITLVTKKLQANHVNYVLYLSKLMTKSKCKSSINRFVCFLCLPALSKVHHSSFEMCVANPLSSKAK